MHLWNFHPFLYLKNEKLWGKKQRKCEFYEGKLNLFPILMLHDAHGSPKQQYWAHIYDWIKNENYETDLSTSFRKWVGW